MSEALDCESQSCWFATKFIGQRVNGPCRCLRDLPIRVRNSIIHSVQLKVVEERNRCAKIAREAGLVSSSPTARSIAELIEKKIEAGFIEEWDVAIKAIAKAEGA